VLDEGEALVTEQVLDVLQIAGDEIVQADDLIPFVEDPLAQMGAQESGPAGDHVSSHSSLRPVVDPVKRILVKRPDSWSSSFEGPGDTV
jgi:hypothetical protein